MEISLKNRTRQATPRVRFDMIANHILPKDYELSVVLVGRVTSRRLNKSLRSKDKATNVLSFPLSKTSGEIFLDLSTIKREYQKFGMKYNQFIAYLFIHGLLHLIGMEHGLRMEEAEKKNLNVATNRHWY